MWQAVVCESSEEGGVFVGVCVVCGNNDRAGGGGEG